MNCPKCGAENINGSTFCIKCGTTLKVAQPVNNMPFQNQQFVQTVNNLNQEHIVKQSSNTSQYQASNNIISTSPLNYLTYGIAVLLKPIKSFKEEEQLNNSKTSFLLTLIMTLVMTVINLIKTILVTVRVPSYSFSKGYTYSWQWDNLKYIKWLEVIVKNFLIYAVIILAIALVFYLGSLILKKQLSFIKSLSITATSIIPMVVGSMVLSPIIGMIWSPLGIIFTVVGGIYSIIILYELMNKELNLEDDIKVYFNVACLGILVLVGYFSFMKIFSDSGLDTLLDLFK